MPFLKMIRRSNNFCFFNEDFNWAINNVSVFLVDLFFGAGANIVHVMMWSILLKICLVVFEFCARLLSSDHLVCSTSIIFAILEIWWYYVTIFCSLSFITKFIDYAVYEFYGIVCFEKFLTNWSSFFLKICCSLV